MFASSKTYLNYKTIFMFTFYVGNNNCHLRKVKPITHFPILYLQLYDVKAHLKFYKVTNSFYFCILFESLVIAVQLTLVASEPIYCNLQLI